MTQPFSTLPVRSLTERAENPASRGKWPATVPAVRDVLDNGLDFATITVFVGDNGSGKSTLVEGLAHAYGLGADGGTINMAHRSGPDDSGLGSHLQLVRGVTTGRPGVFLRAESMATHFDNLASLGPNERGNHQSHGESFMEFITNRARIGGLWLFDEVESALSFSACLALIAHIHDIVERGAQVVLATHSPILAAIEGAQIYELGPWGLRSCGYDDLELVRGWREFLAAPERFTKHLR